jgi:hypothetical protein
MTGWHASKVFPPGEQAQYRCHVSKSYLQYIIRAKRMMEGCEVRYLEDPGKFPNLMNYILFSHVMEHDYTRAGTLYDKAYRLMEHRGPDVHILLYSYAVYAMVTSSKPLETVLDWIRRADAATDRAIIMEGKKTHPYMLANVGFYLQAVVTNPCPDSWLNYAVCRQLVFKDLPGTEDAYMKVSGPCCQTLHTWPSVGDLTCPMAAGTGVPGSGAQGG